MTQVKSGDTVQVHYTGRLEDGKIFDSSEGKEPLQFTLGKKTVIAGVEAALLGMSVDEQKTVTILPEQAYGQYESGKELKIPRTKLPQDSTPQPGMLLEIHGKDGAAAAVPITAVTAETVTIDANHPLAGKTLIFDLKLVRIIQS